MLAVDVMKENEKVALVRSYCQKGSLRDYIYKVLQGGSVVKGDINWFMEEG